jgi:ActR/RegA family two-component response regulator/signal transduction histidine kinase
MAKESSEVRQVVAWLPAARWLTCGVLWGVVVAVWFFPHLDLPLRGIAVFGLTAAICRTAIEAVRYLQRTVPHWMLGVSQVADVALLTGLLDITGGAFNPFIVMYAITAWLAFATLSPRWGLLVTCVSLLGFSGLVLHHVHAETAEHHRLNDLPTHLFTMWFAAMGTAELVGHYVARAAAALRARQQEVDEARARAARSEHFGSLITLAAGAAHELSTPLATIAVASRELERAASRLAEVAGLNAIKDDAHLIRTEVDRCHVILDRMSGRAGDGVPTTEPLPVASIVDVARSRLSDEQSPRLRVEMSREVVGPQAPGAETIQALSSLLKNAFEASGPSAVVTVRAMQRDGMVRLEVHDTGSGMSPETIRRAGEPFYTTKEPWPRVGSGIVPGEDVRRTRRWNAEHRDRGRYDRRHGTADRQAGGDGHVTESRGQSFVTREARTMLIVDDDVAFRERLVRAMRDRGYDAVGVGDHASALRVASEETPELAVVDLRLSGGSGLAVIRDLRQLDPATIMVVLTGYGSIATAVESIKLGAASYLTKPADADQIIAAFHGKQPPEETDIPSLARVEWEHIQRVLADCGGNVSQAARLLGIHRRSLQRKLAKAPVTR